MRKPTTTIRKILARARNHGQLPLQIDDETAPLRDFIQDQAAKGLDLPLSRATLRFARPPHEWNEWQTITFLARLIADGAALLKAYGEALDFSACADMLLDKNAWDDVFILTPASAPAEDADLMDQAAASSRHSPEVLRKAAPLIRAKAEEWRRRLMNVRSKADDASILTGKQIFDARILLDDLIRINDPVKLTARFQESREKLDDLKGYLTDLDAFHAGHFNQWLVLLATLERVAPHRAELEKDPEAEGLLRQMDDIAGSSRPFGKADVIDDLIAAVDQKHAALIADRRASAITQLDRFIAAVNNAIETHDPPPDLRNQALYPLHAAKKQLSAETSLEKMRERLRDAGDHTDDFLERIESGDE